MVGLSTIFFVEFFVRSRNLKSFFKPISSINTLVKYIKYINKIHKIHVVVVAFVSVTENDVIYPVYWTKSLIKYVCIILPQILYFASFRTDKRF